VEPGARSGVAGIQGEKHTWGMVMTDPSLAVTEITPVLAADLGRLLQAHAILQALPAAVYTTDSEGRITFFNEAAAELWGCRPEIGSNRFCGSWRLYWPDGRPMRHEECPMAVALRENRPVRGAEAVAERPDGTKVPFIPYPTPVHDASGALLGAVNMLVDISERKRAEERQKALLDELNHRVKNMLATVQSLATQSFRRSGMPQEERRSFERRLFALATAHDQLSRGGWESAELSSILRDLLAPFADGGEVVRLQGEPVRLSPKTALTLATVIHELATNAVKHGALSTDGGSVALAWTLDGEPPARSLVLDWQESGGPPVTMPEHRGFGSRLLDRSIRKELRGSAELSFEPAGVRCRIELPVGPTGTA
jgi:PAS domain S-box-containing protein